MKMPFFTYHIKHIQMKIKEMISYEPIYIYSFDWYTENPRHYEKNVNLNNKPIIDQAVLIIQSRNTLFFLI